jgi:membrane protein YqaA with SNARE-associated domain
LLFCDRIRLIASDIVLGAVVFGAAILASVSADPAGAAAALAAVQSTVSCATTGTTPCVSGTNTSSGIGVLGASNTGTAVRGNEQHQ